MKRCPECRRDYFDDSLLYCLDDGSALLDGPTSASESKTQVLNGLPAEGPTRHLPHAGTGAGGSASRRTRLAFAAVACAIAVLAAGYYLYLRSGGDGRIDTIAVMPFANATGNPDLEYLSDGLTDALIGSLGQIPNLNVKSRSAVFRYKGAERDVRSIGAELGVPAILNGRVVQRGDGVTLYVELVDAATENSIWQNTYNKPLSDLAALQSELARDVARKLGAHLSGVQERKTARDYSPHAEALELYMRGRFHTLRVTRPELLKAIPFFQRAIELDPNYALAYVGLADAYRGLPLAGEMDPQEYFPRAKAAAQKAVEIDESLAEAHAVLGWIIYWYDWDWEAAEAHCRRALELDPASSDVHMALAHILSSTGRHEEAIAAARRGREMDPLNARTSTIEAQFLIYAGRTEEAIQRLEKVNEVEENYWFAYQFMASAHADLGRYQDAIRFGEKGRSIYPENTRNAAFVAYAAAKAGDGAKARHLLADMRSREKDNFVPPFSIALVHLGLGEREEAIRWLERGIVSRDPRMVFLYCERKLTELRGDPDFENLLRRMRFVK